MEKIIRVHNNDELLLLFGSRDENLRLIESAFKVSIVNRHDGVRISGGREQVKKAAQLIESLFSALRKGATLEKQDILRMLKETKTERRFDPAEFSESKIEVSGKNLAIAPKTKGQQEYIDAIRDHDIVFGIGPAGTGKTYLAMATAVAALKKGQVRRIILTRPAIEAGESLGFLPGDMYEKISPYLRPLYDALYDMMEAERIEKYLEMGIIEVAPLAYMRGRTLNDAFIILDEAQNCTSEQLKMFLTRLGFYSKTVITGDITQSDLPGGEPVGLIQAQEILKDIEGIKFIQLTGADVVRHELVQQIIKAYEKSKKD
jgi:phosphate starvation-inducible protein PhoH and related proteins